MISKEQFEKELELIITNAIREDIGDGDHTSLSCIPADAMGKAKLLVKEDGIIAGVEFAKQVFSYVDEDLEVETFINDGDDVKYGDIVFHVSGKSQSILMAERLVLNAMQRMSAIATKTAVFADLLKGTKTKVLDTRKTRPLLRNFEKYASRVGGAINHRLGLDDCLMLKDTHLKTIDNLEEFVKKARKRISWVTKIEIECETFSQVQEAMHAGADIIMCDNMSPTEIKEVAAFRDEKYPHILLEASGNITQETIESYLDTGINAISSGSIIHQATWLDFSMKFD